jgi:hypothetical protein
MLEIPRVHAIGVPSMLRRIILSALLGAAMLASPADSLAGRASMAVFPDLMLWAWERPEDLRALDAEVGVAFLAQTLIVDGTRVIVRPRLQPLRVNRATRLMAVTRIEHPPQAESPDLSTVPELVAHLARSRTLPRVLGVQIDYDAAASERAFYRTLIQEARKALGRSTPLSITALASWCMGDDWLENLPIDEAVPMLFRMGPANEPFFALAAGGVGHGACERAVGVSLDEPLPLEAHGRRSYVFSPRTWSDEAIAAAHRGAGR